MELKNRVVLITGASTGIGLALAKQLRSMDTVTIATARHSSLDRFKQSGLTETERFQIYPLDVCNYSEQKALFQQVMSKWGRLDVLVNNAGVSLRSVIEHLSPEEEGEQFATNYFGPMNLARLFLPVFRKQKHGLVINISSVGGMMAMPTMGCYSASKFALEGASEALWYELRPWNVGVCLIEPGFVHSDSFHRVKLSKQAQLSISAPHSVYQPYYHHMSRMIQRLMNWAVATPESIARRIVHVMEKNDPPLRVPVTIDAWAFLWLRRLVPRFFYHRFLYRSLPHIKKWGDQ